MRIGTIVSGLFAALLLVSAAAAARLTEQPLVDAAWLEQHLDQEGLVILDIRSGGQNGDPYAAGHVPGALRAPFSTLTLAPTANDGCAV